LSNIQNKYLIFNARTDVQLAHRLQEGLQSYGHTEVIKVNLQHGTEQDLEGHLTLDVVALAEKLQAFTHVYFLPRIPSWDEKLADLVETDLVSLSNALNMSLLKGIQRFTFLSDIEAMGASMRPMTVDETSLWSGQTKANEVQKYWYLCEQECARAGEEGLQIVLLAASYMAKSDLNEREHDYSSSTDMILKALHNVHLIEFPLSKLFVVQEENSSRQILINERENFWSKLFGKKKAPLNSIRLDHAKSDAIITTENNIHQ